MATGLVVATVVGKIEGSGRSVCLQQKLGGVLEQKCTVHTSCVLDRT